MTRETIERKIKLMRTRIADMIEAGASNESVETEVVELLGLVTWLLQSDQAA